MPNPQNSQKQNLNILGADWDNLTQEQKVSLELQIAGIDLVLLRQQQKQLQNPPSLSHKELFPFKDYICASTTAHNSLGSELMKAGRMGCLVVAGGQGTRLRYPGPKGMFPVTKIRNKSLFQLLGEKVVAAGKYFDRPLQLAIMTSPLNHHETQTFFQQHHYFGLAKEQIDFFSQGMLPLLNESGDPFLDRPDHMAEGPDGNGSSLIHFMRSGISQRWKKMGIRHVNFIQIDNALADPFDPTLLGFHAHHQCEVTIKCTERLDATEKVGVVVRGDHEVKVVEYTELKEAEKCATEPGGHLKHRCANISMFCFSINFIQQAGKHLSDKWHLAHKAVPFLNNDGQIVHPKKPMAWKFERFIFDALKSANKIKAILYPRETCFAPLKNFSGKDSIETVQTLLQQFDISTFETITGTKIPNRSFELSPAFYYPTKQLLEKWQNRSLPDQPYIEE